MVVVVVAVVLVLVLVLVGCAGGDRGGGGRGGGGVVFVLDEHSLFCINKVLVFFRFLALPFAQSRRWIKTSKHFVVIVSD